MSGVHLKPHTQTLPNGFSFDLLPVEAGSFMMGNDDEDAYGDEKHIHRVSIGYKFLISKYPVTQELWKAVLPGENPSYFKGERRPVEQVSWYDAAVFCNALNEMCNYTPCYFRDPAFQQPYGKTTAGYVLPNEGPVYHKPGTPCYRLPTEAEWEYAARGGATDQPTKYAGSNRLDEVGWYGENSHGETKPVGLKLPNALGICDMSGNVWEWCEDQWHDTYEGAPDNGSAWVDQEQGSYRVYRGGSWINYAQLCRPASRNNSTPASRYSYLGFRLVLSTLPV
ncbi:MAG: formylglycine-generating enzyme family protein [Saprospiraceae bacterium]|nr:formylglycine-generating enzyme family protein [Saprospiraceae bacterium]